MPSKRYSGNSWRSTEELGGPSGTWWRVRRGLGLRWSGDGVMKKRLGRRRTEMMQGGSEDGPRESQEEGTPLSASC